MKLWSSWPEELGMRTSQYPRAMVPALSAVVLTAAMAGTVVVGPARAQDPSAERSYHEERSGSHEQLIDDDLSIGEVVEHITGDARISLRETTLRDVAIGVPTWIALMWEGDPRLEAREVQIRATGSAGVTIEYPGDHAHNPRDFTSLWFRDGLGAGERDFSALRITVDPDAVNPALTLSVSYVSDSGPGETAFTVGVETAEVPGDAGHGTLRVDDQLLGTVAEGTAAWLALGVQSDVDVSDLAVTVTDDAGLSIAYPAERNMTSLHRSDRLAAGERDHFSVFVDADGVSPGRYVVRLDVRYWVGGAEVVDTIDRIVEITASTSSGDDDGPQAVEDPAGTQDPAGTEEPETPVDPETPAGPVLSLADGNRGWRVDPFGTDTAVSGIWAYGRSLGSSWYGRATELPTSDGTAAWYTGPARSLRELVDAGSHDVDGGMTSLLSPSFVIPENGAVLSARYVFAHLNNSSPADSFTVSLLIDGERHVLIQEQGRVNTHRPARWTDTEIDLEPFRGATGQILITVTDAAGGSLVEGALSRLVIG